jgi:hypothetical protein
MSKERSSKPCEPDLQHIKARKIDKATAGRLAVLSKKACEQLPSRESSKAYALFCKYRNLGPTRSLAKLKQSDSEMMVSLPQLFRYSSKHNWVERAEAYDRQTLADELKAHEELVRKFNIEKAQQALEIMDRAFLDMFSDKDKLERTPRENRERYKMGFDIFRAIFKLDNERRVEQSGTLRIIFSDDLKDV